MITPRSLPDLLAERPALAGALLAGFPAGVAHFDREGRLDASNAELAADPGRAAGLRRRPGSPAAGRVGAQGRPNAAPGRRSPVPPPARRFAAPTSSCPAATAASAWCGCRRSPPRKPAASDGGVWVTMVDLGERKSLDLLRSQILGVVAHDLRNPLSAMRMTLAMLVEEDRDAHRAPGEPGGTDAGHAGAAWRRWSPAWWSRPRSTPAASSPSSASRRTSARSVRPGGSAIWTCCFPTGQVEVERRGSLEGTWDVARLERVLTNLLTNALKHGRTGRTLLEEMENGYRKCLSGRAAARSRATRRSRCSA